MSNIDSAASVGPELCALRDEELDAVSGGKKTITANKPKTVAKQFDDFVSDAVVTAAELATIHSMN